MTVYEPGTVAIATVSGVPDVRVVLSGDGSFWWSPLYRSSEGMRTHGLGIVTDVRPLVVLDLDKPEYVAQLLRNSATGNTLNDLADQIEAQTKPPRIPEPGLWGVVSTQNADDLTDYWTNGHGGWFNERGEISDWRHLPNPTLIREGVDQ